MQKILGYLRKAIEHYQMIEEGDKIAVGLSGGKDSITLLMGLKALQRFYPKHFEMVAVSVNPNFDFFNTNFRTSSVKYRISPPHSAKEQQARVSSTAPFVTN